MKMWRKMFELGLLRSLGLISASVLTSLNTFGADWYVRATPEGNPLGNGTEASPYNSFLAIESVSKEGDTIYVMDPGDATLQLDGGIRLKSGQKLIGLGVNRPKITHSGTEERLWHPRIKRATADGDIVTLSENNEVAHLHLVDAGRNAILSENGQGHYIHDNEITGYNARRGWFRQEPWRLIFGYGGIEFVINEEGLSRENIIRNNRIAEGLGMGIQIIGEGAGNATFVIRDNVIESLKDHSRRLQQNSMSGLFFVARDQSTLAITIENCLVQDLDNASNGLTLLVQESGTLDVACSSFTYYGSNLRSMYSPAPRGDEHGVLLSARDEGGIGFKMENSTIAGCGHFGLYIANGSSVNQNAQVVDLGGGELGSVGRNRFYNNGLRIGFSVTERQQIAIGAYLSEVSAKGNWWGYPEGIGQVKGGNPIVWEEPEEVSRYVSVIALIDEDSVVDTSDSLTEDPLGESITMAIRPDGDSVILSWSALANFYDVEEALSPSGPWSSVADRGIDVLDDVERRKGRLELRLASEHAGAFFRLRHME